jgi:hypothetical protein
MMTRRTAGLEFGSPGDRLDHHQVFDLITRVMIGGTRSSQRDMRQVVGHGLAALGFGERAASRLWRDDAASVSALEESSDEYDREMLRRLWVSRANVAGILLSWDNVIEGHPVLAGLDFREDRAEFAEIADDVLGAALKARETMNRIDAMVLKRWGGAPPRATPTLRELAKTCPSIVELNGLYSAEESLSGSD